MPRLGATRFATGFFRATAFLAEVFLTALRGDFLTAFLTAFRTGLRADLRADLRGDFRTADLRRVDFFAADFLRVDFFAADFLRVAFFAVFLVPPFRAAMGTLLE